MVFGTVKWFCPERGYGYVATDNGVDVFVHVSALGKAGIATIGPGDRLAFDVREDRTGKGPRAINLALLP